MNILMISLDNLSEGNTYNSEDILNIATGLSKGGHKVHIIMGDTDKESFYESKKGIKITRVINPFVNSNDYCSWVMQYNFSLIETVIRIIEKEGPFDYIETLGWKSYYACKTLKWAYKLPIVSNFKSLDIENTYIDKEGIYISEVESELISESIRVVVTDLKLKGIICEKLKIEEDKIWIIPTEEDLNNEYRDNLYKNIDYEIDGTVWKKKRK